MLRHFSGLPEPFNTLPDVRATDLARLIRTHGVPEALVTASEQCEGYPGFLLHAPTLNDTIVVTSYEGQQHLVGVLREYDKHTEGTEVGKYIVPHVVPGMKRPVSSLLSSKARGLPINASIRTELADDSDHEAQANQILSHTEHLHNGEGMNLFDAVSIAVLLTKAGRNPTPQLVEGFRKDIIRTTVQLNLAMLALTAPAYKKLPGIYGRFSKQSEAATGIGTDLIAGLIALGAAAYWLMHRMGEHGTSAPAEDFANEVIRLDAATAVLLPRFKGNADQAGLRIVNSPYVALRDPEFGDRPHTFDTDRYRRDLSVGNKVGLVAFGKGHRCPGDNTSRPILQAMYRAASGLDIRIPPGDIRYSWVPPLKKPLPQYQARLSN